MGSLSEIYIDRANNEILAAESLYRLTESEKDSIENFIVAFPKQLNSYIKYIKGCLKK